MVGLHTAKDTIAVTQQLQGGMMVLTGMVRKYTVEHRANVVQVLTQLLQTLYRVYLVRLVLINLIMAKYPVFHAPLGLISQITRQPHVLYVQLAHMRLDMDLEVVQAVPAMLAATGQVPVAALPLDRVFHAPAMLAATGQVPVVALPLAHVLLAPH